MRGGSTTAGGSGGSGGGSGHPDPTLGGSGTSGQGYSGNVSSTGGAVNGGGGGGSGGAGSGSTGGTSSTTWAGTFAGGGGGGFSGGAGGGATAGAGGYQNANGGSASANTGSGGGGGGNYEGKGGNGGSGIVVIRYFSRINNAPTVSSWPTLPSTPLYYGDSFTAQATGSDTDSDMYSIFVDVRVNNGQWRPHAHNAASGTSGTSDGNTLLAGAVGTTYEFRAQATDIFGAISAWDYTSVYTVSLLDTDGDGIDDGFEQSKFSNLTSADETTDADTDGLPDLTEYNLGTEPNTYDAGTSTRGNSPTGWTLANGDTGHAVGATAGSASVDKSGAFTYSIPIWTTPGTSGMSPKISLNYSSQAGPGIAGYGWSIGGVSAITRGPQTIPIDGKNKGVTLTADDRFYLDGQRLLLVSGTYGAAGSKYRTELDSITEVTAEGAAGSGPASFTARTKSGLTIKFGHTADSAFDAWGKSEKISWHASKISDTSNNYMEFEYTEDAANGVHILKRIDYTGNDASGQTAVAPYASLRFDYDTEPSSGAWDGNGRPDWVRGYLAGSNVSRLHRLKTIKSYYDTSVARTYTVAYSQDVNTGRSMLDSLTEAGSDGLAYPALTFQYQGNSSGWVEDNDFLPNYFLADNSNSGRPAGSGFVDLNGDGRTDFVARRDGASINMAYLNTGTGWTADTNFNLPYKLADSSQAIDQGSRFADVNGDGLVDYLWFKMGSGGNTIASGAALNTGTGWDTSTAVTNAWTPPAPISKDNQPLRTSRLADVNGDGLVDYVALLTPSGGNATLAVYLNTGTGWASKNTGYSSISQGEDLATSKARLIDLNGDGLVDIIANYHGGGVSIRTTYLNTGSGWSHNAAYVLPYGLPGQDYLIADNVNSSVGTEFVDANGDGLPDLLKYRETGGTHDQRALLNTGAGWVVADSRYFPSYPLSRDGEFNAGSTFMDVNADGMPDLLHSRQFSGQAVSKATAYGTGRGWSAAGVNAAVDLKYLLLQGGLSQTGADSVDFDGDGVMDTVWYRKHPGGDSFGSVQINQANPTNGRLITVTNGMGATVDVVYDSLLNSAVYTKGADNSDLATHLSQAERDKIVNVAGPMYVVSSVVNDNNSGGHTMTYNYAKLRTHRERGSLGFGWMKVHDTLRDFRTQTTFRQDYPYIGQVGYSQLTRVSDLGPLLSTTTNTWAQFQTTSGATYPRQIYTSTVLKKDYDYITQTNYLTTTTTSGAPDAYGNIGSVTVSTSDGFAKTTTNTYKAADTTNWILGRLETSKVDSTGPTGYDAVTRKSAFTYFPGTGLLETEKVQPVSDPVQSGEAEVALTTTYEYDRFGNKKSISVAGSDLTVDTAGAYTASGTLTRTTTTGYDTKGRFPVWTKNAVDHQEDYTDYDQVLGVLKEMEGANDLVTKWEYDGFGRKKKETRADLTVTDTTYGWTPGGSLTDSKYFVESKSTGSAPVRTHYDKLGRSRWTQGVDGDGHIVYQQTFYDTLGRASASTMPYRSGGVAYWTTSTFDGLDRPLVVVTPDDENGDQTTEYDYSNFTTTVTDPKDRVTESTTNSQGWTTSSIRNKTALGGAPASTVTYVYNAIGDLTKTTADSTVTTFTYDIRGNKLSMTDPTMGTWKYRYNVFGELIWQKDAKSQISSLDYDALGRLTSRVETEGTTTWTYDSSSAGGAWKGKLYTVTSPGGYSETYTYDSKGRTTDVTRTIDSVDYVTSTGYDSASRPNKLVYPDSGLGADPFTLRQVYNDYGYLKEVRYWLDSDTAKANSQLEGKVYWEVANSDTVSSYDPTGRVEAEIYGNGLRNDRHYSRSSGRLQMAMIDRGFVTGDDYVVQNLSYTYDPMGNLSTRYDASTGRDEKFYTTTAGDGYDGLDRLKVHTVVGGASVTVSYDTKGNITNKSDVGNYTYSGYGPYAVSSAGSKNYTYDLNGNMLTGGTQTYDWTTFNQVKKISDSVSNKSAEFSFGANRERIKQVRKTGGSTTDTTIYAGSLYEKVTAGSLVTHKHYIMAPTGRIAVFTDRSDLTHDLRYFHTDGLGSITVVSDEAGRVLKRYTYDAWGKQSTSYTNNSNGITNQAPTTRGFTDHEELSDFGLVHMNGRIYDATLGRFLSGDPFVGDTTDAQEYNRYSYLTNNPLGGTDPTGFISLKDVVKIVAVVAIAYVSGGWGVKAMGGWFKATLGVSQTVAQGIAGGLAAGFSSGFAGTLLNGGSIGDAFKAGVIGGLAGAVTGGILGKIGSIKDLDWYERGFLHGVTHGGVAEATGGKFSHGFYSGFLNGSVDEKIGTIFEDSVGMQYAAAAAVGGTGSVIGGGKFANGAISGAFSYMFNQMSPKDRKNAIRKRETKWTGKDEFHVVDELWVATGEDHDTWGPVSSEWVAVRRNSVGLQLVTPAGSDSLTVAQIESLVAEYRFETNVRYSVYDTASEKFLRYEIKTESRYAYRTFNTAVLPIPPKGIRWTQYKNYAVPAWDGGVVPWKEWQTKPRKFGKRF